MEKLHVYADFDWLCVPIKVGELNYESLRGSDTYGFKFDSDWLRNYGDIVLSDDLNNYPGMQYTQPGKDIFGCFSDALPDWWGRTLLNRREQIEAIAERRPAHRLSSFDYLICIDDASRMGGFRFKLSPEGEFINAHAGLKIPPMAKLRELIAASKEIERSEEKNILPEQRWITQLLKPGSSLGGARPKASVLDEDSSVHIAKFPSRKDDYDVAAWEHLAHLLAKHAGIDVAETQIVSTRDNHHTLLSRRFDRTAEGKRVHFASALTLLGLTDGDNATTGHGYIDIVDFIVKGCDNVEANLEELYRRVAFNIAIGNTDDHFRNHGFILTRKGWTLSPAYDLNPTTGLFQSLLINSDTNESSLKALLNSAEDYMIPISRAKAIIDEVLMAFDRIHNLSTRLNIPKRELEMFNIPERIIKLQSEIN